MSRRRAGTKIVGSGIAAAVVVAAGLTIAPQVVSGRDATTGTATDTDTATTRYDRETVQRRTLEETADVNGTVGFGATRPLNAVGEGVVTAAPEAGDVIGPGDEAVRVGGQPIALAEGSTPMYRELRRVRSWERDEAGDELGEMTGDDVEQLQDHLIGLGLDQDGRVADEYGSFGRRTAAAVEEWQRDVGHPATGRVDSTQLLFVDGPVRVETAPAVGAPFADLTVSDVDPIFAATVTNQQRSYFAVDGTVDIELADRTITGTVTDLVRSVGSDGSTTYRVEVSPRPDADIDGVELDDTAKLTARRVIAEDVLTVPVRALIALAEGGWAVQVDGPDGPMLKAVELGDVVDGFAEITGIDEGTAVLVVTS